MKKILLTLFLLLLPITSFAQCKVGWDTYTGTATEFRLYIAPTTMGSATYIKVSPTTLTEFIISDSLLIPGVGAKSYIRATGWNSTQGEGDSSNEVVYTRPIPTTTSSSSTTTTIKVQPPRLLRIIIP